MGVGAKRGRVARSEGGGEARRVYRREPGDWLWANRAFWTVVLLGASALLSAFRFVTLPEGGSVTFLSLLPLWLVTYFYGPRYGCAVGAVFGFARLAVIFGAGEWVNFAPGAIVLEYPVACGAVALGGMLLRRGREGAGGGEGPGDVLGLRAGYLVGVLAMGVCYVVSALLFYAPEAEGLIPNLLKCVSYDMSYLLIEATLTELLLCRPPCSTRCSICATSPPQRRAIPPCARFSQRRRALRRAVFRGVPSSLAGRSHA